MKRREKRVLSGASNQGQTFERGRLSRHERHYDERRPVQQQHRRDDQPRHHQQLQQEEGTSMAQEMRQFMAELRDAIGIRRQDEEEQQPGKK